MVLKANWYPIISNAIFFTVYLDIIIIIMVTEINFLYFLLNVIYKQPNISLRLMTPGRKSQGLA